MYTVYISVMQSVRIQCTGINVHIVGLVLMVTKNRTGKYANYVSIRTITIMLHVAYVCRSLSQC